MNWTAVSDGYGGIQPLRSALPVPGKDAMTRPFGIGSMWLTHATAAWLSHAAD
ncbi:hypothetical protein PANO111632_02940 [Paracoccus nototheniae]